MFFKQHAKKFQHCYLYADEHKAKIDEIKRKAAEEIRKGEGGYSPSRIKGFLTDRTHRHIISTTTAVLLIAALVVLWYFLIY